MNTDLIAGLGFVGTGLIAGLALHWLTRKQGKVRSKKPQTQQKYLRPAEQIAISTAAELFEKCGAQGLVQSIRNNLGLSPQNWSQDALPVLERYAEYVQLLPASESHHHAQPGGLLMHTLEVVSYALIMRKGYKLPVGHCPEHQAQVHALWSYAVMLAALLHDAGKPVSDVVVQLYGASPDNVLQTWQGLAGPMGNMTGATHYTVNFPATEERNYQEHQRLASTMLHALVPPGAMRWLASDNTLLPVVMAFLDQQNKDDPSVEAIAQIIKNADSQSVADNLKNGSRVRFARARQTPLIERLMYGLRTMLSQGHLSVNRAGATVFFDPDGVHLWAVSAALAEKVRAFLDKHEIRHEGAAGIPADNTRLFDTWSEYDALIRPPKEYGKGSVWWVRVAIEDWSCVLTVLKLRIADLYPAGAIIPKPLNGSITPVKPGQSANKQDVASDANMDVNTGTTTSAQTTHDIQSVNTVAPTSPQDNHAVTDKNIPEDEDPTIAAILATYDTTAGQTPEAEQKPASNSESLLDANDCASAAFANTADPTEVLSVTPAVQAFSIVQQAPKPKFRTPGTTKSYPDAAAFLRWIQLGLGTGELSYNDTDSVVHFTEQGMAILSPKAFKLYLQSNTYAGVLNNGQKPLNALQNDLQRGGYIARSINKSNFTFYRIRQANGQPGNVRLSTYVIPNPQAYIRPVPAVNPLLILDQ